MAAPPRGLAAFAAKMTDRYGAERVPPAELVCQVTPTGALTLDYALRTGGWSSRGIYEVVGEKDAGKSTVVLSSAANFQRLYPRLGVGYIDMEGTFSQPWAAGLGVACTEADRGAGRWLHLYPNDSEDASDMARDLCRSGLVSAVIVDSIGGMESRKAFAKDAGDDIVGKNAQVITRMCKHLASLARLHDVTVILVNQYRANLSGFGGPVSAGPMAMQHATTVKIEMKRAGGTNGVRKMRFGDHEEPVSVQTRARVTRQKNGAPGGVAEFWINNRPTDELGPPGINIADEYVSLGIQLGAIQHDGSGNYTLPGGQKVKSRPRVFQLLLAEPEAREQVRKAIFEGAT